MLPLCGTPVFPDQGESGPLRPPDQGVTRERLHFLQAQISEFLSLTFPFSRFGENAPGASGHPGS